MGEEISDSDSDDLNLSIGYNPLSRKRLSKCEFPSSSQLTYKQASSRFSSKKPRLMSTYSYEGKCRTQTINPNASVVKKKSITCEEIENKLDVGKKKESGINEKKLNFSNKEKKSREEKCGNNLQESNFNCESPDIDFLQLLEMSDELIPSESTKRKGSKDQNSHVEVIEINDSDCTTVSDSLLKDIPRSVTNAPLVMEDKDLPVPHPPFKNPPVQELLPENQSSGDSESFTKKKLCNETNNTNHKVMRWLNSCDGKISSKVCGNGDKDIYVVEDHYSDCEDATYSIKESCSSDKNIEKCFHIHVRATTPTKKSKQTTLDSFFGLKTQNKMECTDKSSSTKADWDNFMNTLKNAQKKIVQSTITCKTPGKNSFGKFRSNQPNKKCPFYKFVEDTNFVVDAFNYGDIPGVQHYFLSHYHSDHYIGLKKDFNRILYCSPVTANLVLLNIRIEPSHIIRLPLEEPRVVDGVEVVTHDANHCPGAVMFIFRLITGKTILHVGDFRANKDMQGIPCLKKDNIDLLYLDTTYLNPHYTFPLQSDVLQGCATLSKQHYNRNSRTLFVVGSYYIGKEKVVKSICSAINGSIYADPYKTKALKCQDDEEINHKLCPNKRKANVHFVKMRDVHLMDYHIQNIPVSKKCKILCNFCDLKRSFQPSTWEQKGLEMKCKLVSGCGLDEVTRILFNGSKFS